MGDTADDKQRLLELVKYFKAHQGEMTEEEVDRLTEDIEKLSPDPEVLNYIFYPTGNKELRCEEIVERAFSYKPIITPPPSDKTG